MNDAMAPFVSAAFVSCSFVSPTSISSRASFSRTLLTTSHGSSGGDDKNYDGEFIDNVVSKISGGGIVASMGTIWSEWAVATTGCGPTTLSNIVERGCYYGAFAIAALSVFTRIAFNLSIMELLDSLLENTDLLPLTTLQVKAAETLSLAAVCLAIVVLIVEINMGTNIWSSGLSGIDQFACRAAFDQL